MLSFYTASAFGLCAALATATTASTVPATNEACQCTFGTLPVPVDLEIPTHPENGLTTTDLRRLKAVYDIFGVFCQPKEPFGNSGSSQSHLEFSPILRTASPDRAQLLLHGSTYTHQYWTFPMNGVQNYSYVAHACLQGQTTFAYDQLGVGLSERPRTSKDVQIPTVAQVSSYIANRLKDGTIAARFGLGERRFDKVVGIGHSQGSTIFNYAAIVEPTGTGLDAMILTGHIHDPGFPISSNAVLPTPAREVNPARWGNLDPGYIATPNRSQFYSADTSVFSQDVFMLDTLTQDVSTLWYTTEVLATYRPARGYTGPVVELVGAMDQLHCTDPDDGGKPCDAHALQIFEAPFFPDSRNFTAVVREGSGHDVNLDFGAAETFALLSHLADTLV
ncbi:hypothetical protein EIP86_008251 [Pleurotus ostreatoroseus]|nr:hypothetical protein EIP86_008251 [Pleurotus ostreatoroseus]